VTLNFDLKPRDGDGAGGILAEARNIVVGARNHTHGEKERSFAVIAGLWSVYLAGRKDGGASAPVTAFDVAWMMTLLKCARSIQGTPARDHFVDGAGYAAIAGELGAPKSVPPVPPPAKSVPPVPGQPAPAGAAFYDGASGAAFYACKGCQQPYTCGTENVCHAGIPRSTREGRHH
jgi:hypothetical protein